LPGVKGVAAASASLDRTGGCASEPSAVTELCLGQASASTGCSQFTAESRDLLAIEARRLAGEVRMLELGHARCMVIPRPWPGIRPQSTLPSALVEAAIAVAEHENLS